ncbi:MAG TPA: hypothetical protein VJ183_11890 [Chloroflexia bacterium]|nr:hypothetical protein [Chloroflexia bacterium]
MTLLKEQLKQALASVEEKERMQTQVQEEGRAPSTMAEVEQLEQKLTDALEELRTRKAQLQKDNES